VVGMDARENASEARPGVLVGLMSEQASWNEISCETPAKPSATEAIP
jgi:hypothetical protein